MTKPRSKRVAGKRRAESERQLLRKTGIGQRTLYRWVAVGCVEPAGRGEWPPSAFEECAVAKYLVGRGWPLVEIGAAREQGRDFLGLDAAFCALDHDLLLQTSTRGWLIAYVKHKADGRLDQPAKIWVYWNEAKRQLQFVPGHADFLLDENGRKIFVERIETDPSGRAEQGPPSGWKEAKKLGEIVGRTYRREEGEKKKRQT